ncbi:S-layer homology domain-containing protein [Ferdinandcohnia quinoae]|uniref:S-layer homology domain-containing protein n=1 Tax=Fredinandcohnia quinoae TaxID=2918902 RepID=A0AAW5E0I6_9BACI|nr:S-layer homology domain-containing protein [Fredinandcohnia sp. SECRCQ15]MCH1625094.1 S-layer homology domain-containing protein [Fredinandcohnia sp. SECRCQ15]
MHKILRHELKKEGTENIIVVYLDPGLAEFAKEMGSSGDGNQEDLNRSIKKYVAQKFPNLKNATVRVMVGSMLVTSIALTPATFANTGKASAETIETGQGTEVTQSTEATTSGTEATPTTGDSSTATGTPSTDVPSTNPSDGIDTNVTPPTEETTTNPSDGTETVVTPPAGETELPAVPDLDEEGDYEVPFTDIETLSFEKFAAIWTLQEFGVINGYGDGTYRPGEILTRGQAALMFYNTGMFDAPTDLNAFSDVKNERYLEAVAAMKDAGVFVGKVNNSFGLTDNLTREQMAATIVRAFDLQPIEGVEVDLKDLNKVSRSLVDDVEILYQHGITVGNGKGEFNPTGTVNRGDFALFLYRAVMNDILPSSETSTIESIDNGDNTATLKFTLNDRRGFPVPEMTADLFSIESEDDFFTLDEDTYFKNFTEIEEGVYEVTYTPGSPIDEHFEVAVLGNVIADDLHIVVK